MNDIIIELFGNRLICIRGIGKMFYQDGFPISMAIVELNKQGIEVSLLHIIEEFWNNGWSWKTIENKLKGEVELDIDKVLKIDFNSLKRFYYFLEQPARSEGGYEQSREMIFQYLFNDSLENVKNAKDHIAKDFLRSKLVIHE